MKIQINLDAVLPNRVKSAVQSGMLFCKIKLFPFPEDGILPEGQGIQAEQKLNSTNNIQCFEAEVTESGKYKCYTSTSLNGTYTERKSFGGSAGKEINVSLDTLPTKTYQIFVTGQTGTDPMDIVKVNDTTGTTQQSLYNSTGNFGIKFSENVFADYTKFFFYKVAQGLVQGVDYGDVILGHNSLDELLVSTLNTNGENANDLLSDAYIRVDFFK